MFVRLVRRVRPGTEMMPRRFGDVYTVVLRRLLDISEGQVALGVRYTLDLIEASQRVLDVSGVRERLFALFRESVHAIRQFFALLRARAEIK